MEKKAHLVGDVNPKTSAVGEERHNDVVAQKPKPKSNELPALPPGPFQGEPFVDIMRCNRPAALGKADIVDIFALGQQQPKGDRLTMCPRPSVGEGRTRQAKAHRWQRQRQEQKCPVPRRGRSMVSRSSNSHGTVHAMSWVSRAITSRPRMNKRRDWNVKYVDRMAVISLSWVGAMRGVVWSFADLVFAPPMPAATSLPRTPSPPNYNNGVITPHNGDNSDQP
ncbi:hypothetical protein BC938DRAFT_480068 [Jimgerdemannia flammicorona]|uniref:Uncharacterized protein n=1 Tax=Jimgerdemannia flammicorona TaxID=994334 RepID=A0A433QXH0_9FUNG|nr:hypothetical protein BC938DRAFT_480068 [Jimgerdemannia flammicorona]